jgi:hypothetical protein
VSLAVTEMRIFANAGEQIRSAAKPIAAKAFTHLLHRNGGRRSIAADCRCPAIGRSRDVSKDPVERMWHVREVERVDEQRCVADLPPAAASHEAPKLLLGPPSLPPRLLLESAEGPKISVGIDDPLYRRRAESADQLILEICDADVETESFHLGAGEVGAEAGLLEGASKIGFLAGVAQPREPDPEPAGTESVQETANSLRAADRHYRHAFGLEVAATTFGERFERDLVADALDEHDCTHVHAPIVVASPAALSGG